MAFREQLRSRDDVDRDRGHSVARRGLRPFYGLAAGATLAPWLPLKNNRDGMRQPTRSSTIFTTTQERPFILADGGRSAIG